MLDKPREDFRKIRIEAACINSLCGTSDDLGTAAFGVAPAAVVMGNAASFHYATPKEVMMDKPVHNHHRLSSFEPEGTLVARAYHEPREGIGQNLVGDAKNASEGTNQGFLSRSFEFGVRGSSRLLQLGIDPSDEVTVGDVSNEQEE